MAHPCAVGSGKGGDVFLRLVSIVKHPDLELAASTSVTREFFSSARRHLLLLIAVRPRNSAIRCFLLYFQ
jgi:hypothetical protein